MSFSGFAAGLPIAVGVVSSFIVNPATSAASAVKRCEQASDTLESIKKQYQELINKIDTIEKSTGDPNDLLTYTVKLTNDSLDNVAKFNDLTNSKTKLYKTLQILSISIVCLFIVVLSLKYLFSEKIKESA